MNIHVYFCAAAFAVLSIPPATANAKPHNGFFSQATSGAAQAGETISIGGVNNILIRRAGARGSLILLTGGDGELNVGSGGSFSKGGNNSLIRNRNAFAARGFDVLLVDSGTNLDAAVKAMAQIKRPVSVVATSRGTLRAAQGIAQGARPDRLVLTSGFLSSASGSSENVMSILGNPALLPRTLVVHHREDGCRFTNPAGVAPFKAWAGSRAQVAWLSGGVQEGNLCEPLAHHGFNGLDGPMVALVANFAR